MRTGKDRFEIHTPKRDYFLYECENLKLSSENWIDRIQQVIDGLEP